MTLQERNNMLLAALRLCKSAIKHATNHDSLGDVTNDELMDLCAAWCAARDAIDANQSEVQS